MKKNTNNLPAINISAKVAVLDKAIADLNTATRNNDAAGIAAANEVVKTALSNLNADLRIKQYAAFLREENPIKAALTEGFITVKGLKTSNNKLTGRSVRYEDCDELVDLNELEALADKKCFNNGQWIYWVEAFTQNIVTAALREMDAEYTGYKLSDQAKEFNAADPASKSDLTRQLQKIIDGILYIPEEGKDAEAAKNSLKVMKKDVTYIVLLMCREGKKTGIRVPRADTMAKLITKVAHRIVTNGDYEVEE